MTRNASSPAVVAVRTAVERAVADLPAGTGVAVACSGGPDSLALAGAAAWVSGRRALRLSAIVADHGLQAGSADVATAAADTCRALGVDDVTVVRLDVHRAGGPEAAARSARYAALEREAERSALSAVLLGHTREDQAETVLLRLARGSGARSLSAMRAQRGIFRRPFLDLPRDVVHAAAAELLRPHGLQPWLDPHNEDPQFSRVRVRALLGNLTDALGPGSVLGLTRSAQLLGDDADALDTWAVGEFERVVRLESSGVEADCDALAELPRAVRTRVIRLMSVAAGVASDEVGVDQVRAVEALVSDWRGQGSVALATGVTAERAYGRLCLRLDPRREQ